MAPSNAAFSISGGGGNGFIWGFASPSSGLGDGDDFRGEGEMQGRKLRSSLCFPALLVGISAFLIQGSLCPYICSG